MDEESEASRAKRVQSLWSTLDVKGKGHLDLDGLRGGLRRIKHPLRDAEDILRDVMRKVDLNGDGAIEYNEFVSFVHHAEKELWRLFKSIDGDDNNKLSKAELHDAFVRAGIFVPSVRLDEFFKRVDKNNDGVITFDEWRDFLLFLPADSPGLKAVLSYAAAAVKVNPEGDVQFSDETIQGLGNSLRSSVYNFLRLFNPTIPALKQRQRPPDGAVMDADDPQKLDSHEAATSSAPGAHSETTRPITGSRSSTSQDVPPQSSALAPLHPSADANETPISAAVSDSLEKPSTLMALLPKPGYFLSGGIAGIVSRTSTAPLDRLKVYLIAQTETNTAAVQAVKSGAAIQATKHAGFTLVEASRNLWRAGGIRSLWAGNGLNVAKVMPESAIKFGSYEASKRFVASLEGHNDTTQISALSQFVAGGLGGVISQACVYPLDTLKFRMQCETVEGGLYGNRLIATTAKKMWKASGFRSFYRGLPMGLVGMFPYSAIDLFTFETLKRQVIRYNMKSRNCSEEAASPGPITTATIGGFSGALGASLVYPLNLVRTRLQTQGTVQHPRTYTGIWDVTMQTVKGEGMRGLFKGLTPNLLKVVPAVSITYVVYESSKKALHLA